MWVLRSKIDPERCHVILCGEPYSVGRKDTDIVLLNDMSISRKHAILHAIHPEAHVMVREKLPVLTVEDLSKLGTVVGEKRLHKEKGIIHDGDILWFGNLNADNSRFVACFESYTVTTSCLEPAAKRSTRQLLSGLGGHMVNEWNGDCDALIMNNLSITIKAVCALICQKPIVTPAYLEDKLNALQSGAKQPNTDDYLPQLAESQLNPEGISFTPNPQRQNLFSGMHFIFLTKKQFKKMSVAITSGGGTALLMEEKTEEDQENIILSPKSRVMWCEVNSQSQQLTQNARSWIEHVLELLKAHKKRPIQECEIGYAVLFCSTKEHCNPDVASSSPVVSSVTQKVSETAETTQVPQAHRKSRDDSMSQIPNPNTVKVKTEPICQSSEGPTAVLQMKQSTRKRDCSEENTGCEPPGKRRNTTTAVKVKSEKLRSSNVEDEMSWTSTDLSQTVEDQGQNASDDDMFASVPVQKRRKVHRSPTSVSETLRETVTDSAGRTLANDVKDFDKKSAEAVCDDKVSDEISTVVSAKEDRVSVKSEFISKENVVLDDEFVDKNIVAPQLIIEEKPLVVRKPTCLSETRQVNGSSNQVKNFKKFRKVYSSVCNSLPKIIGGADLVASSHKDQQELEEWFRDYAQSGSQQESQVEKDDLDFMNWDPRRTGVRKRRK